MPSQNFENSESPTSSHEQSNKKMRDAATAAFGKASEAAHDAREKPKRAAADVTATMSDQVMGVLNEQLSVGAQSVNRLAGSMRVAADDLARENPILASLVRGFAHNVDDYAERLDGQTVEQLAQDASDFTRRQPALMFGLAAIVGFFAFRTFKHARSVSSPPIQPTNYDTNYDYADQGHG